jgi:tight adherence protein B
LNLLTSFIAASLALIGWALMSSNSRRLIDKKFRFSLGVRLKQRDLFRQIFGAIATFVVVFSLAILLTTSLEISASIALISTAVPFMVAKHKAARIRRNIERAWPETIDYLISSLHSGQSISEGVVALDRHGPEPLRNSFSRMSSSISSGATLTSALSNEIEIADSAVTDQVLTALIFAKEFGGHDVTNTLRLLATFLRDEAQIQDEIETRFGWVKNSALLGAIAPWLLLALLSMQPSTVEAYSTSGGRFVLSIGVIATAISFIWMERIAKLPQVARPFAFSGEFEEKLSMGRNPGK